MDDITIENCEKIFPEVKTSIQKELKKAVFYKVGLWRKLHGKQDYNAPNKNSEAHYLCDKENISWEEIESNLDYILPLPVNEREKTFPRYPLQPDDPLLKISKFSLYESLLGQDDEEEEDPVPVTEIPKREEESKKPPEVERATHNCLRSLSSLYESLTDFDILSSSQISTDAVEIKDAGWWVKQPTAGLSDTPRISHPKMRSCSSQDIIEEYAQKALNVCAWEIASALEEVSSKDWPQFALPCHRKEGMQSCIVQSAHCEW